jgi:hypothetical protein
MEWLRVEFAGKLLHACFVHPIEAGGKPLPDFQVF